MLAYLRIGRPQEAHEVHSAKAYRKWQAGSIQRSKRERPSRPWRDPFVSQQTSHPQIRQGRWVLPCACGNAPSYDPEWQLACCPDCGAVYEGIAPPVDYLEIEQALMRRPRMINRNYLPGETARSLRAETAERLLEGAAVWPG